MYHYSFIDYRQIEFKSKFYVNEVYKTHWESFLKDKNYKPFGSIVYKFDGDHPQIIKKLLNVF